jgi:two-component system LytT family response regulator
MRVLIADDEALARRRLQRLVGAIPDVELVGECETGDAVLARVHQGGVDVILLDIHMPGLTGVEAMQLLPAAGPYVIFCTAHPDHAVAAFDGGAVDYLLKPIEAARLHKALERARSRDAQARFVAEAGKQRETPGKALERLAIPTRAGVVLVAPQEITHAALDGVLVTIHTTGQGKLLTDFTLQDLQEKLPPNLFERVHRRALLNMDHVRRLEPLETGGYLAHTSLGATVEVSRQSARDLRRRLGLRKPADEEG